MEEELFQMMAGAVAALSAAGCALVGGHSSEGPEPALGFSVTGAHPVGPAVSQLPGARSSLGFPSQARTPWGLLCLSCMVHAAA